MKRKTKKKLSHSTGAPAIFEPLTPREKRLLDSGLLAEIRRLDRCRKHIARIDQKVLRAGISRFGSAPVLALWLSEPAVGLAGKAPFQIMRTAKGRKDVANLLGQIDYGVY